MSELQKLIEQIDALYAKATPGRHIAAGEIIRTADLKPLVRSHGGANNTVLYAALVNAWPTLRSALSDAREKALEEAAKIATRTGDFTRFCNCASCQGHTGAAEKIAEAIRALLDPKKEQS